MEDILYYIYICCTEDIELTHMPRMQSRQGRGIAWEDGMERIEMDDVAAGNCLVIFQLQQANFKVFLQR